MSLTLYHLTATIIFFATGSFAQSAPSTRAEPVHGLRPMGDAVLVIEHAYSIPIGYEDIFVPSREATHAEWNLMKHWTVTLRNDITPENSFEDRKAAALDALNDLLERHKTATGYVDPFAVIDLGDRLAVVPRHSPKLGGGMVDTVPVLDTKITIPSEERTGKVFADDIAQQLSTKTGVRILSFAPKILEDTKINIGADNLSARSALNKLLDNIPVNYLTAPDSHGGSKLLPTKLSYQILCAGGGANSCGINLHYITDTPPDNDPPY